MGRWSGPTLQFCPQNWENQDIWLWASKVGSLSFDGGKWLLCQDRDFTVGLLQQESASKHSSAFNYTAQSKQVLGMNWSQTLHVMGLAQTEKA